MPLTVTYKCKECGASLPSRPDLIKHWNDNHSKKPEQTS